MTKGSIAESPSFFEGPEKKFEVMVSEEVSLRDYDAEWRKVIAAAQATVLSVQENQQCIAYLLSESSLFVFDNKATMITCGRTNLVGGVMEMLNFVHRKNIELFVYERKNEHFPEEQHSSFQQDARKLRDIFGGEAFQMGRPHQHYVNFFIYAKEEAERSDHTIEILMHDLPREKAQLFQNKENNINIAGQLGSKLDTGGFEIDDCFFEPEGYSLNAIRSTEYFTIHVTPEEFASYVSFESNTLGGQTEADFVCSVVGVFCPRFFDVVRFAPARSDLTPLSLRDYLCIDRVQYQVAGYQIAFESFQQHLSEIRFPHFYFQKAE